MSQFQLELPSDAASEFLPFMRRVILKNFRSIGHCDVRLSRFTALVGRNGAGKSNFLDGLRFIADGLQSSLDHAIKSRGGIANVRRRSTGHPRNFTLAVEFGTADGGTGKYEFEVAARTDKTFLVKHERLELFDHIGGPLAAYRVSEGTVQASIQSMPRTVPDRLYLVNASNIPEFRAAYDALTSMGFYNLNPEVMKELQSPDAGELLLRDGSNIASVISRLQNEAAPEKVRLEQYLEKIVSGVAGVAHVSLGPRETVQFLQQVVGAKDPWRFYAANMSDGTLRALGVLASVSQVVQMKNRVRFVGIEEPETALHPAAAQSLMKALLEATDHTQVAITTHSTDLLDVLPGGGDNVLVVEAKEGETHIRPIDRASRQAIKDHLYSAGELLRMDQLEPAPPNPKEESYGLFEPIPAAE